MKEPVALQSRVHKFGGETWEEKRERLDAEWEPLVDEKRRRVHGYAHIAETPAHPSMKGGKGPKLRVCRWQPSPNPSVVDGRWSAPCALFEHQLEPLPPDFDLTSRRGQIVAAARRSVVNGLVRWQVSPRFSGDKLTEVHNVGKVLP